MDKNAIFTQALPPPVPGTVIPVEGLTPEQIVDDVQEIVEAVDKGISEYKASPGRRFFNKLTSAHFLTAIVTIAAVQGAAILTTFPQHQSTQFEGVVGLVIVGIEGVARIAGEITTAVQTTKNGG